MICCITSAAGFTAERRGTESDIVSADGDRCVVCVQLQYVRVHV